MAYIVNNYHMFKSEILPKRMTEIFYSQFVSLSYLYIISRITNCEIQLDGKNPHLTNVNHSSIEPRKYYFVDGQICTGLKPHFVTKYLIDGQVLVHRMHHYEYQQFQQCQRDHSLNVMTGLCHVLNNILTIYIELHFK